MAELVDWTVTGERMLKFNHGPLNGKTETLCTFKSGGDEGEPLWNCEECDKPIPKGGDIHFIPDGGMSPDGTYVGACCVGLWFNLQK